MHVKNASNVPSDKYSIISCVPYRARVMVIIRATVSKVTQNNLERTLAAWLIGGSLDECERSSEPELLSYFPCTLDSFKKKKKKENALEIIESENPF